MSKSVVSSVLFSKNSEGHKYFRFNEGNISYFVKATDVSKEAADWLKANLGETIRTKKNGEPCTPFRMSADAVIEFEELGNPVPDSDEFGSNGRMTGNARILKLSTAPSYVDDLDV